MPGTFGDSPGKCVVREQWDTPLLKYLHSNWGVRFRYMGLPGVDMLDLQLWKDMIEEVTAFEVPNESGEPRASITQLRRNLRVFGKPFVAYYGPFEEVVLLRRDYDGQAYEQQRVITLYNLDFCDEIGSKIRTQQFGRRRWRFDAIRRVLEDQKACHEKEAGPSWFVLFLTVRNQINANRLSEFLGENLYAETDRYRLACESLVPIPSTGHLRGTHTWGLKAFIHNALRSYFTTPHISALFFPLVKYTGRTKLSPMLHWLVFCRFANPERPSPRLYPSSFLSDVSCVRADAAKGMTLEPEPGETGHHQVASSKNWFRKYERYLA